MKKLMIAACAVAFAAVASAATATWKTDVNGLLNPDDTQAWGDGYITMYLWSIDSAAYTGFTEGGAKAVSAAVWNNYKDNLASADAQYTDDGSGYITLDDPNTYGVGDTAYAAIVLAYDEGDGITHYKGNVGMWNFEADYDNETAGMDSEIFGEGNSGVALGWSEVSNIPEPTSGLLLLLGVAGLALKRKRA